MEDIREQRNEQAERARELLLHAHARGFSNVEIQTITGLSMKTIKRWIERPQFWSKEDTIAKILLLDYDYDPVPNCWYRSQEPGSVERVYNSMMELVNRGYTAHSIARISGLRLVWVRRFIRKNREERLYVSEKAVRGAERIEKHLESVNRREGRDARRAAHRRLREAHVDRA